LAYRERGRCDPLSVFLRELREWGDSPRLAPFPLVIDVMLGLAARWDPPFRPDTREREP
jgi:hypothetical protein